MTLTSVLNWPEANQRYLNVCLSLVRDALAHHIEVNAEDPPADLEEDRSELEKSLREARSLLPSPSALDQLESLFGLTPFERDILLLCAGMEMDATFPALCAEAQGDPQRPFPTFGLAMAALPYPHWQAMIPSGALRRWQLIEMGSGRALTLSPLRIDERVLHFLVGVSHLDERLVTLIKPVLTAGELVDSHRIQAERLVATWTRASGSPGLLPLLQLCGFDRGDKQSIALKASQALNLGLYRLAAHALPTTATDLHNLVCLWDREAKLSRAVLYLDCDQVDLSDTNRMAAVSYVITEITSPLIIGSKERWRSQSDLAFHRALLSFDVNSPTVNEQRQIWWYGLGSMANPLAESIESLVGHFSISAAKIRSVCEETLTFWALKQEQMETDPEHGLPHLQQVLWDNCRQQARQSLDDLAQRIEGASDWEDLVLPDQQKQVLRDIAAHVKQRAKVYETWGFAGKTARGTGISALFAGASGTGKTMAAEVIAKELHLDLFRIDLSTVVSKYIGETEKNLSRLFAAAEAGGSILLFDEADSLFGKRSDVKDSHDRYANMEVSYLLQRMEAYRGLSILTTNLKDSIDTAFMRRIRFVIRFPFPDVVQRAEIWRRVFPTKAPTEKLRFDRLAQLQVAGGNIRNIALNAAFLAADANEPVKMEHVLQAARNEYTKLERTLTDSEIKGWI